MRTSFSNKPQTLVLTRDFKYRKMENFPNEMLVSIFKHLPQQDLNNVTLVCRQFNSVIEEFSLIKRMRIRGAFETEFATDIPTKNDESWMPRRNYSEATVINFIPRAHLGVIESHGDRLTMLELTHSKLNLIDLVQVLRSTPNVKVLSFGYVSLKETSFMKSTELPKLQNVNLKVTGCDLRIFRVLQQCSMVKVDLYSYRPNSSSNAIEFEKFLKNQKSLISLALRDLRETELFQAATRDPLLPAEGVYDLVW